MEILRLFQKEDDKKCPICGSDIEKTTSDNIAYRFVNCPACGRVEVMVLQESFVKDFPDDIDKLASYLYYNGKIDKPINKTEFFNFIGSTNKFDSVNSKYPHCFRVTKDIIDAWFPKTFSERVDMFLLGIAKRSNYMGEIITFTNEQLISACFAIRRSNGLQVKGENIEQQVEYFLNYLTKQEYIEHIATLKFKILPKGYNKIENLQKQIYQTQKNVFIAMSYNANMKNAEEAIKQAIVECGFLPRIMKDIEHNRQIVPELLYEIRNSRFVIADLTMQNNGAYYEAGYALGCGKEVIQTCRKGDFDKEGHFDVKQINTILWDTEAELFEKLIKRIKATIE